MQVEFLFVSCFVLILIINLSTITTYFLHQLSEVQNKKTLKEMKKKTKPKVAIVSTTSKNTRF